MTKMMTSRIEESIDKLITAFHGANKKRICDTVLTAIENLESAMQNGPGRPKASFTEADIDNCINNGITTGAKIAEVLGCSQPTVSRFLRNRKSKQH